MGKYKALKFCEIEVDPKNNEFSGPEGRVHVEPLVMDLFVFLARRAGEIVTRDELIESIWQDYPGADQSLSNTASKLRAALEDAGGDREGLRTVPKRGYRLAGTVHAAEDRSPRRMLLHVVLAGMVAVVVAVLVTQPWTRDPGNPSLAVLAFDDLSPSGEYEYLAHGIAEELIYLLGRIPGLQVVGRTSSFSFAGTDATIPEIGAKLGVSHVLEGSVRTSGGRLRITVQLLEAEGDTHLWAETYDRALPDVFAVQEQVASDVASTLKVRLLATGGPEARTDSETYALYLQAKFLSGQGTTIDNERTRELLDEALERDPGYVPVLNLSASQAYRSGDRERARKDLESALSIDPDNAVANTYLGWRTFMADQEPRAAARLMEKALARAPRKTEVLRLTARFARSIGRFEEAIALATRAVERDPLCGPCLYDLSKAFLYAARYDKAEYWIRRYHNVAEGGFITLGNILLLKGEPAAALDAYDLQKPPKGHEPSWLSSRAMALHSLGRREEFASTLENLTRQWGERYPRLVARVYAWADRKDEAFDWLDRGIDRYQDLLIRNPYFGNLRDEPRWTELLRRQGLGPEQRAAIEFDPILT